MQNFVPRRSCCRARITGDRTLECAYDAGMPYRQKSHLDVDALREPLSKLLNWPAEQIILDFQNRGYSGSVFRIAVAGAGRRADLLLKGQADPHAADLYKDVLGPLRLNSPRVLGEIPVDGGLRLVMEYVPHDEPDWADPERFRRAVDWLVRKDAISRREFDYLSSLRYLNSFDIGDARERVEAIALLGGFDRDLSLTRQWRQGHGHLDGSLEESQQLLREGPQTITHNDFQMFNVLFGTGHRRGELFVVDWTCPAIGSVCIDLATLIRVAPPRLRAELIARYRERVPFEPFEPIFRAAQFHVNLAMLKWMAGAIGEGQDHAVNRALLREIVSELNEAFERRDLLGPARRVQQLTSK